MSIRHKFFKPEIQDSSISITEWNDLNDLQQLDAIIKESNEIPIVIFKHSTRCDLSSSMLKRFETNYDLGEDSCKPYYLDLITYRKVSDEIALRFDVVHQSPQVILINNGKVILNAIHEDIAGISLKDRV